MNSVVFDALVCNGSREELKAELAVLREARRLLQREDDRLVARQKLIVEALARRQEEELNGVIK